MKRGTLIIILLALVIGGVLFYFIIRNYNRFSWYDSFLNNSKQPYGCMVAAHMLEGLNKGKTFSIVKESLKSSFVFDKIKNNSLYVFIGNSTYYDSTAAADLLAFVDKGNEAFIASPQIPNELRSPLNLDYNEDESDSIAVKHEYFSSSELRDSIVTMNFFHPALQQKHPYQFDYVFNFKKDTRYWNYFLLGRQKQDTLSHMVYLGFVRDSITDTSSAGNENVNFIRIKYGKGFFYFHSDPIAFTNFYLIKQTGFDYADKVFGHLKPANIYWDEASKIPDFSIGHSNPNVSPSPLSFILSRRSLRWAWYILLLMVLLFVLFRMKRNQRAIPILEKNVNTSLEFIQTIGRLYFLQNDHIALANQKMKLFLQFVRHRYNLSTRELNEDFIQKLSEKSQLALNDLSEIFNRYKFANRNTSLDTEGLIEFHNAIDKFYKNCK